MLAALQAPRALRNHNRPHLPDPLRNRPFQEDVKTKRDVRAETGTTEVVGCVKPATIRHRPLSSECRVHSTITAPIPEIQRPFHGLPLLMRRIIRSA